MTRRVVVLLVLIALAGGVRWQTRAVAVTNAGSLAELPMVLASWQGRRAASYAPNVVAALGVDQYIHRNYTGDSGQQANLYVGYYRSQEQGASIHSPLNCLPGAGWEAEQVERVPFAWGAARRVFIHKGSKRMLVLYWYQTAMRIEGDEYRGRFYTAVDTMRYGRNDAAFVRVTVDVAPEVGGEGRAIAEATELATALEPHVSRVLFPALSAAASVPGVTSTN